MTADMFHKEQGLLERCEAALGAGNLGEDGAALVKGYGKLLKQIRRLVSVADANEAALQEAKDYLEEHIRARTDELAFERVKLERLVRLGITMASERRPAVLLQSILDGALEISNADGGTLYTVVGDKELAFRIVRTGSLGIHLGGTAGHAPSFPAVPLFDAEGRPNHKNVVSQAVHLRQSVNIEDAYESQDFDFSGTRKFDAAMGYRSQSFLTVPLIPRGGEVIGALQLINAKNDHGDVIPFTVEVQSFVEALAAQAAVAIDNQNLIEAQRKLLDSFIELIAGAIDAKSAYTGGHCARVPELARLLAEAACAQSEGPFANFAFTTEEEWREFRIASWLHDCGKVTTPEYIVDKATKLEAIYNRIHEVRMRFEVLWRDAEIDYWRKRAEGSVSLKQLDEELEAVRARLQDDFAFIAECNVGGEFMSDKRLARLQEVAELGWTRYFNDTLGLSHEELRRRPLESRRPLPAEEKLLADQPYHVIPRDNPNPFGDNPQGFKVEVPKDLYNLGELYNLRIGRGTLTPEDRFKITDHVIQTIAMLNRLPFPKTLARVPEYAGAHHETMIGTGYPRKLNKEQMSVPARIMAIADIFEALTACDRPYKKAKTLSEALKIMSFMVKDQHIDADLFHLFLDSGVYQTYAKNFLMPEQLDPVDPAAFKPKPS